MMMILMVFGGLLVIGLTAVVLLLRKKKPKGVNEKYETAPSSTVSSASATPGEKSYDDYLEEEFSSDSNAESDIESDEHADQKDLVETGEPSRVTNWDELPAGGQYLDADESGTVWYKTAEGEHWYRNDDDSWSVYDSGSR